MKRTLHKALSMLLTAAMVLNIGMTPVFAEGVNPPGISGVCTHHTHTEDCYIKTENCQHKYNDTCGYTSGSPCEFDAASCDQCNPDGEAPAEKVSTCEPVIGADETGHGKDCPL